MKKERDLQGVAEHVQQTAKAAIGRWIFNLLGFAIVAVIILVQIFQLQKKELNSVQFWSDLTLLATFNVVMWVDQYCSGKCKGKQTNKYLVAQKSLNNTIGTINASGKLKELDGFCTEFIKDELSTRRSEALLSVGIPYSDFEEIYLPVELKQIWEWHKSPRNENVPKLTRAQVLAIFKAKQMKPVKLTKDMLMSATASAHHKFKLGLNESQKTVVDIMTKGMKYVMLSAFTAYFGLKLVQVPTVDTVANIIYSLIPSCIGAVMGFKKGVESITGSLLGRINRRHELLIQFCDTRNIQLIKPENNEVKNG